MAVANRLRCSWTSRAKLAEPRRLERGNLRGTERHDARELGESIGQSTVPVGGGVLIAKGRRRAGVTGAVHKFCCRGAGGSGPGQPGVSEVVQMEVGSAGCRASPVPGPVEITRSDGLAGLTAEQPGLGSSLDIPLQVLRNQRCHIARDGDGAAAGFSLGWSDGLRAVSVDDEGSFDAELTVEFVNVPALKPEDLASA
jgi:hypothetical protein